MWYLSACEMRDIWYVVSFSLSEPYREAHTPMARGPQMASGILLLTGTYLHEISYAYEAH